MENLDDKLAHWLAGVFVVGLAAIVVITGYQILFPCPDFTNAQSGYSADATWTLFPPGPRCEMDVKLKYGVHGIHTDWPSFFRIFALICWLGWMGTIVSVRRHLRRAGLAGSEAQLPKSPAPSPEGQAANHRAADGR